MNPPTQVMMGFGELMGGKNHGKGWLSTETAWQGRPSTDPRDGAIISWVLPSQLARAPVYSLCPSAKALRFKPHFWCPAEERYLCLRVCIKHSCPRKALSTMSGPSAATQAVQCVSSAFCSRRDAGVAHPPVCLLSDATFHIPGHCSPMSQLI